MTEKIVRESTHRFEHLVWLIIMKISIFDKFPVSSDEVIN